MRARLRSWLKALTRRKALESDLAEEIQAHIEMRTEHWQVQGLPAEEAARRARLEFGGIDRYKDECRQARGVRLLDELRVDARHALRQMRRAPLFSAVAVGTLALGIGANTAIFSLVEAALLKSLPVSRPGELRELQWRSHDHKGFAAFYSGTARRNAARELTAWSFSYPAFLHLRDHATSFSDLFAFDRPDRVSVSTGGQAELARGQLVSGGFFHGLGLEAELGRTLTPEDDAPGAPEVAVITHVFWQRALGGDPAVVGRTIHVNTAPVTIVGVTPPSFVGITPGEAVDLMLPMALHRAFGKQPDALTNAGLWWVRVMGRLRADVPVSTARAEAESLVRQAIVAAAPAKEYDPPRIDLNEGGKGIDTVRRRYALSLGVMGVATAAILLAACANVAGLLLTRGAARQREIATRAALGASRARLLRQALTESTLLALTGGLLGLFVSFALRGVLPHVLPAGREPLDLDMKPGTLLYVFSLLACLLTGGLCGLLPALRATRVGARLAVARAVAGRIEEPRRPCGGRTLVAFQVALSLVLLVSAGLFVRTMSNLRRQEMGFRSERILLFQMDATLGGYEDERLRDFYRNVVDRVSVLPGVRAATCSQFGIPAQGAWQDDVVVVGADGAVATGGTHVHQVAPRYFETMGVDLQAGRDISWTDDGGAPRVAIVNRAFVRRYFGGTPPMGRSFELIHDRLQVIGIVRDVKFQDVRDEPPPTIYVPYRQHKQRHMTFAVKTEADPAALVASVRASLAALDPDVPIYAVRSQEAQNDMAMGEERLFARLVSSVAVIALLLSCLGLYGTLAYSVARRTGEIGVRMALGANHARVVRMVLGESLLPVLTGAAVGLAVVLGASGLVRAMLFGLEPTDPATLVGAALIVLVTALAAAWLPSRRAARVEPMAALRCE
jgi:predicted permease